MLGPLAPVVDDPDRGEFPVSGGVSRLEVFERVADACLDLPVSMIDAGQFYEELFGHVPLGTTTSAWFQYLLHPRYRAGGAHLEARAGRRARSDGDGHLVAAARPGRAR